MGMITTYDYILAQAKSNWLKPKCLSVKRFRRNEAKIFGLSQNVVEGFRRNEAKIFGLSRVLDIPHIGRNLLWNLAAPWFDMGESRPGLFKAQVFT